MPMDAYQKKAQITLGVTSDIWGSSIQGRGFNSSSRLKAVLACDPLVGCAYYYYFYRVLRLESRDTLGAWVVPTASITSSNSQGGKN